MFVLRVMRELLVCFLFLTFLSIILSISLYHYSCNLMMCLCIVIQIL